MQWVAVEHNGVDTDDKPRKLTPEEINYIANFLPSVPSAEQDAGELARENIVNWIIGELQDEEMCPSAIKELIETIVNQHNNSLIAPGSTVAITAAEAVGATSTQITLNSVVPHEKILIQESTGFCKVTQIGEWIDLLLERNNKNIVHFEENRTEYLQLDQPVNITTSDNEGNVTWEEVTAVTRHLPVGDLVKVTTLSGREVTATCQKSFLVWDDELQKLNEKDGSNLKIGDCLSVACCDISPVIGNTMLNLGKFFLPKISNDGNVEMEEISENVQNDELGLKGFIPLDGPFGKVVGLFLNCGSFSEKRDEIIFTNIPEEMIEPVKNWCNTYKLDTFCEKYNSLVKLETVDCGGVFVVSNNHRECRFDLKSPVLVNVFDKWLKNGTNIPNELMIAPKDFIIGLLRGYISSYEKMSQQNKNDVSRDYNTIRLKIEETELREKISYMCNRLGIFTELSGIYLIISNPDNILETPNTTENYSYQSHKDIILDPIVNIEQIKYEGYVYDLTIPKTLNFTLFNGLNMVDTFHTSGSIKSASFGIDSLRDIIFARKIPKNESCTIYFNELKTFEEVLNARSYIVGSVFKDFVKDYDIDYIENLPQYWWNVQYPLLMEKEMPDSIKILRLYLDGNAMFKHRVTISQLASILENDPNKPGALVTCHGSQQDAIIDVYTDYPVISEILSQKASGVVLEQSIAETAYLETIVMPELEKLRVKGISGIKNLFPRVINVTSMVFLERKLKESDLNSKEIVKQVGKNFERTWVLLANEEVMKTTGLKITNLAALLNGQGDGIPTENMFSRTSASGSENTLFVIMPETEAYQTASGVKVLKSGNTFYSLLDNSTAITVNDEIYRELKNHKFVDGLFVEEIDENITATVDPDLIYNFEDKIYKKLTNIQQSPDGQLWEPLDKRVKVSEISPKEFINRKISEAKKSYEMQTKNKYDKRRAKASTLSDFQKSALLKKPLKIKRPFYMWASEFVIADTQGQNLKELFSLSDIDSTRTTCNNMNVINEILGIESARTHIITTLNDTITSTGSYVHPANIIFIAEFITSRGIPLGATYTGISRQPGGHLSLATIERAGKVFMQNALHGRTEDIRSVSASVAVGTRANIGNGYFDVAYDIVENGVPKTILNDDITKAFLRDDTSKQHTEITSTTLEYLENFQFDNENIPDMFDDTKSNDETNLHTLFNLTEKIIDTSTKNLPSDETLSLRGMSRRVPRTTSPTEFTEKLQNAEELMREISQIGTVLPEGLLDNVVPLTLTPQNDVISTGLVSDTDFEIEPETAPSASTENLSNLVHQYLRNMTSEKTSPFESSRLPELEVVRLPDLSGFEEKKLASELNYERTKYLKNIQVQKIDADKFLSAVHTK